MGICVQKYGGSSVATAERILHVADRIGRRSRAGDSLVVVVSAMGDTTDELLELATRVTRRPSERELDLLLSTGEIVSCTLLAMALREIGISATSYSGAQAGIHTDRSHGRAKILRVDPARIRAGLERGDVAIVAGFQGIAEETEVTTLGRGGSDTTAVALAAALQGSCEIYTDVEGVYTCDPRIEPAARKLQRIAYEEMLEMAGQGARVMHPRAVELGAIYGIPILVASSLVDAPGTWIVEEGDMELSNKVRGITHDADIAKITVLGVPDHPGNAARIFEPLGAAQVVIDAIVQNASAHGSETDLSFTVSTADRERALEAIQPVVGRIGARGVQSEDHLGKVSIVGSGVLNTPGYASRMFQCLADAGINIELITTSEIRITCVVHQDRLPDAVRALHAAFVAEERSPAEL